MLQQWKLTSSRQIPSETQRRYGLRAFCQRIARHKLASPWDCNRYAKSVLFIIVLKDADQIPQLQGYEPDGTIIFTMKTGDDEASSSCSHAYNHEGQWFYLFPSMCHAILHLILDDDDKT